MRSCSLRPVITFFILTFCLSWGFWLPMIFIGDDIFFLRVAGTYGPAAAALTVTWRWKGSVGLVELLKPFRLWRVGGFWYLFCFFSTAVIVFAAIGIHYALGGSRLDFNDPAELYLTVPAFLYVLLFSVLGEETGWRGFALPRLRQRFGALPASLIIGAIWGTWHLPLFLIPGDFHSDIPFALFIYQDIAVSIIITWIYNRTGGSLIPVHIFHTASNTTLAVLPVLPMDTGGDLRPLYITCGLLTVFALTIVLSGKLNQPLRLRSII